MVDSRILPEVNVRTARIDDVPRLIALNEFARQLHVDQMPEKFRSGVPESEIAAAFEAGIENAAEFWLVAEIEGEIAGFLNAVFRSREQTWCVAAVEICYLGGIVVAPEFRRRGVARSLVSALQDEANSRSVDEIELDVFRFNEQARAAFVSLGFEPVSERMQLPRGRN